MDSRLNLADELVNSLVASSRCSNKRKAGHPDECTEFECVRLRLLIEQAQLGLWASADRRGEMLGSERYMETLGLWDLANGTARMASTSKSPFAGYLEAPPGVLRAAREFCSDLSAAEDKLQEIYVALIRHVLLRLNPDLESAQVDEQDLEERGLKRPIVNGPPNPEQMTIREIANWWIRNDPAAWEQDVDEVRESFAAAASASRQRRRKRLDPEGS